MIMVSKIVYCNDCPFCVGEYCGIKKVVLLKNSAGKLIKICNE